MRAPRRRACCSSSRMRVPAPSAMTKPSRSRSKGRLASWGAAVFGDRARMLPKVLTASGTGRDAAVVRPGGAETHRHVSAREIAEHHGRKQGRDAVGAFLYEGSMH